MGIGIHGPDGENARGANVAGAAAANAAAATSSLERALDEATERYSVALEAQRELSLLKAGLSMTAALDVSAPRAGALSRSPGRLRWRGREVSEEFQRYAERVASGEELAPYRGQVLARPCVDSPWGVPAPPLPPPARRSVVFGALLAASAWLVGALLVAPRAPTANVELRPLSSAALYASSDAKGERGHVSLDDVEPLRDVPSGEALSRDDGVALESTFGTASKGVTRTVSAPRRRVRRSSAAASAPSPAGALPAEAPIAPGAAAPPAPETIDDFDWLLDGAVAPKAAASPAPETVDDFDWLLDSAVPEATTPPAAARDTPAPAVVAPPPGNTLLVEKPTF